MGGGVVSAPKMSSFSAEARSKTAQSRPAISRPEMWGCQSMAVDMARMTQCPAVRGAWRRAHGRVLHDILDAQYEL